MPRQDGRWITGGERSKDGRKGKEHKGFEATAPSLPELPSAWVKSWFDLNPISKLLKHLFAFLIWTSANRKMADTSLPNHFNQARFPWITCPSHVQHFFSFRRRHVYQSSPGELQPRCSLTETWLRKVRELPLYRARGDTDGWLTGETQRDIWKTERRRP